MAVDDEAGRWVAVPRRPGLLERWRRHRHDVRARAERARAEAADEPMFGYGRHGRPLWERGHRDEEDIRRLLRKAGHREYHEDLDGFSVSSGGQLPYDVVSIADDTDLRTTRLREYTAILRDAGYRVQVDPEDHSTLQVWPPGHPSG